MRAFREFSHEVIQKILGRLGSTDISSIGDGTVTGAIVAINKEHVDADVREILGRLGDTDISDIGDGTITGGIDELCDRLDSETIITADRTLEGSKAGGINLLSIEGNSEQTQYSGKNLLENTATTQTINGVTFTINEDKSITANGTANGDTFLQVGTFDMVTGQSYILSGCPKGGSTGTYSVYTLSAKSVFHYDLGNGTEFTPTTDISYPVYIRIRENISVPNFTFRPMIRKADIEDDTYEPYVGNAPSPSPSYPQLIESVADSGSLVIEQRGKNVFSFEELYNNALGAVTIDTLESDTLTMTTKSTGGFPQLYGYFRVPEHMKGKTVTLSVGKYSNSNSNAVGRAYVLSDFSNHIASIDLNTTTSVSLEMPEQDSIMILFRANQNYSTTSAVGDVATFGNVQLELGETATEYEPYHSNTITVPLSESLRAIGDIKDEVVYKDGVWGVNRKIRSMVFDGSEEWAIYPYSTYTGFYIMVSDMLPNSRTNGLCDMFTAQSAPHSSSVDGIVFGVNNNALYITFSSERFATVDELTAWLAENNMEIVYPLATPVFEPFTDQSLFYGMKSYDTVTYVSTDSKVEPIITLEYGTSKASARAIEALNRIVVLEDGLDAERERIDNAESNIRSIENDIVNTNEKIDSMITTTTDRTLYGSKAGGIKLIGVKGASEQAVYSGKNILDCSGLVESTLNGITFTPYYDDNGSLLYVNVKGTATANTDYIPFRLKTLPLGNYVLNGTPSGYSNTSYHVYMEEFDTQSKWVKGLATDSGQFELTDESHIYSVTIRIFSGYTANNLKFYPMVSVEGGDYEPYVGNAPSPSPSYPQDIESVGDSGSLVIEQRGKNFFDIDGNVNVDGMTGGTVTTSSASVVENGIITINRNSVLHSGVGQKISGLTGKVATFSFDVLSVGSGTLVIGIIYEDNTVKRIDYFKVGTRGVMAYTCTTDDTVFAFATSDGTGAQVTNVQVALDTDSVYEPYHSNTITIPLNEPLREGDEIAVQNGVWGVLRKIAKVIFDGSSDEPWAYNSTQGYIYTSAIASGVKLPNSNDDIANALCDSYLPNTLTNIYYASASYNNQFAVQVVPEDNKGLLCISNQNYTDIDSWLTDIASKPITLEYELATPVFEPFTDQTPFYQMQSYDTVTYISTDSKVEPSIEVKFGTSEVGALTLSNYNNEALTAIASKENTDAIDDNSGSIAEVKEELAKVLYIVSFDADTGILTTKSADYEG